MSFTTLCFHVMIYRNFALMSLITEAFRRSMPKHLMNHQWPLSCGFCSLTTLQWLSVGIMSSLFFFSHHFAKHQTFRNQRAHCQGLSGISKCYKIGSRKMFSSIVHILSTYIKLDSSSYRLIKVEIKKLEVTLKAACTGGNLKK